jgi:hypothetical protein
VPQLSEVGLKASHYKHGSREDDPHILVEGLRSSTYTSVIPEFFWRALQKPYKTSVNKYSCFPGQYSNRLPPRYKPEMRKTDAYPGRFFSHSSDCPSYILTLVLKLNVEASNYLGEKVLVSVTVYSDF